MEEYYEPQPAPKKKSIFDIFKIEWWLDTSRGIGRWIKSVAPTLIIGFILVVLVFAGYMYSTSAGAERLYEDAKSFGSKAINYIPGIFSRAESVAVGAWDTESEVGIGERTGIVFEEFKSLSKEIPQGSQLMLSYKLGIENTYLEPTRLDVSCNVKGRDIEGSISPEDIVLEGNRVGKNVRCIFSPDQTMQMGGTMTVTGKVSYEYETRDVELPVYFTTFDVIRNLEEDEDFFESLGIPESNPIRAKYYGEPIAIAIGVNTEEEQPVLIEEESPLLFGITLNNKWTGEMKELNDMRIEVPVEMQMSELSNAPTSICPFVESRSGRALREYKMAREYVEDVELKLGESRTFECFFDADPSLIGMGEPYAKRSYWAHAKYVYQLPEMTESITIKEIGGEEEVEVEDIEPSLTVTEVEPEI